MILEGGPPCAPPTTSSIWRVDLIFNYEVEEKYVVDPNCYPLDIYLLKIFQIVQSVD